MNRKPFESSLEKAERKLSKVFGEDNLIGIRDDAEKIWVENRSDLSYDVESHKVANEVGKSLKQSKERILTIEDGVNKLQIVDGLTGGLFATTTYTTLIWLGITTVPAFVISIGVFLLFALLNHGILFTKAIINTVCYVDASPRERDTRLLFKRGWNAVVLSSNSSIIAILIVAAARRAWPQGYKGGLDLLQRWDYRKHRSAGYQP